MNGVSKFSSHAEEEPEHEEVYIYDNFVKRSLYW